MGALNFILAFRGAVLDVVTREATILRRLESLQRELGA